MGPLALTNLRIPLLSKPFEALLCAVLTILLPSHPLRAESPVPQSIATEASATNQPQDWIDQLSSNQFSVRRQAFLQLWQTGKPALPLLAAAQSSSQRTLAESARVLEILIELEVAPNQLEQSTRLLEVISRPNPAAIAELCELKYWDVAERMLQENQELLQSFQDPYGRYMLGRLVDTALSQDNPALAWPLIRQVVSAPQRAWIAHKTGLELAAAADPSAQAQQLFNAGETEAALQSDVPAILRLPMLTRTGRWRELLEPQYANLLTGQPAGASQQAAMAVLYEVADDFEQAAAIWDELLHGQSGNGQAGDGQAGDGLVQELGAGGPVRGLGGQTDQYQLMAAMLFSGHIAPLEKWMLANDPDAAFSFFLAGNQHAQAFSAVGLNSDLSNLDEWFQQRRELIVQELSGRAADGQHFDQCVRLCSTLAGLGYREKTQLMLEELVALARTNSEKQGELWSRSLLLWLGRSEARQLTMQAARNEFPRMPDECRELVLKGLFPELDDAAYALWKTAPGETQQQQWNALQQLYIFDRATLTHAAPSRLSHWLKRAIDLLAKDHVSTDQLEALADVALGFGDSDLALELLMTDLSPGMGQATAVNQHWARAAQIYVQRGTPDKALAWFKSVRQSGSNPQQTYVDEVQAAMLSGDFELGQQLEQARWLRPLATTRFFQGYNYQQAAHELFEEQRVNSAEEYAQAAFLLADVASMDVYWAASEYADILEELEQPQRRADVLRAAWVELLQPYGTATQYMFSNGYTSSLRFSAQKEKLARAIACITQGDLAGFAHHVEVARRLQPQDIEMACQCYPLLVKAGQPEIAKKLFDEYEREMREQLAAWPNDATALNNLAWMYSQCDVKLDEALALSQQAVERAPSSAIFLDTLAEIQFRLGDVARALDTVRQCIRLDPRESHYRENLVRFHAAD